MKTSEHPNASAAKSAAAQRFLAGELNAINLGLSSFAEDLAAQGVPVLHVEWQPPAGGDPELMALLDQLL